MPDHHNSISHVKAQLFFEILHKFLARIKFELIHRHDDVVLSCLPMFQISKNHDMSEWQINALYEPISALNPNIEIHFTISRLLSYSCIKKQNLHDIFQMIAHYVQSTMTQIERSDLHKITKFLEDQLFEQNSPDIISKDQEKLLEDCRQQLQRCAEIFKKHLTQHFLDQQVFGLYQDRYSDFESKQYQAFFRETKLYIHELERWKQENPNRMLWFLYWQSYEHIEDPSYFSYEHLIQLTYQGVPLFKNKGQIKRLFALELTAFKQVIQLIFSNSTALPYAAQILLDIILKPKQNEDIEFLQYIMPSEEHRFDSRYISQYIHALDLLLQIYQSPNHYGHLHQGLEDFIYGRQITDERYTDQLNIALIQPATTANSLLKRNHKWHQQSLHLQSSAYTFSYQPFDIEMHQCRFELIANPTELAKEAKHMEHCILTFAERIQNGTYFAFRVFFADFRGTLGVTYQQTHFSYYFDQVYGYRNAKASEYIHKVARAFCQYLTVEDQVFEQCSETSLS